MDGKIQQSISKIERIRNRQINYMIIRKFWDVIHGSLGDRAIVRNQGSPKSFYGKFIMSHYKLEKIIKGDTGKIKLKSYAKDMHEKTGVEEDIFYGNKVLEVFGPDINKDKITMQEWNNYFDKKAEQSSIRSEAYSKAYEQVLNINDKVELKEAICEELKNIKKPIEITNFEKKLYGYLKEMRQDILANPNMFYLEYFIRHGDRFFGTSETARVTEITKALMELEIMDLEKLSKDELKRYIKGLVYQKSLATAVMIYSINK